MGVRQDRLADEIRDILARCFQGGNMNDPRLEYMTITAVKLSGDLQHAYVYFRVMSPVVTEDGHLPEEKIDKALDGLRSASSYLRKRISDGVKMRRTPEIHFKYDESIEYGSHIESLLNRIRE
jgi:ribosome-binding factor A